MNSDPSLQGLPVELLESVIQHLDFPDICSLRLVCRQSAANANLGFVKSDFAPKQVLWHNLKELKGLAERTSKGWKTCRYSALSIVGLPRNDEATIKKEALEFADAQTLLTSIFTNIHLHGRDEPLHLELDVKGQRRDGTIIFADGNPHWTQNYHIAKQTYKLTLRALSDSNLSIKSLDIFSNNSACGLCAHHFSSLDSLSMPKVTHLSLNLCSPIRVPEAERESFPPGAVNPEQDFDTARLIAGCPNLVSLDLRWHTPRNGIGIQRPQLAAWNFLSFVLRICPEHLRNLQHFTLRGVHIVSRNLLRVVGAMPNLLTLKFESVELLPGNWSDVYSALTEGGEFRKMERMEFRDVHETLQDLPFGTSHRSSLERSFDFTWSAGRLTRRGIEFAPEELVGATRAWEEYVERRNAGYGPCPLDPREIFHS